MAAIDRDQLIQDELLYLPEGNVLTEAQMRQINELVITQVGDDGGASGTEGNYPEVLCKGLRAIAQANRAKYAVDTRNLKREEVGDVEIERFERLGTDPWDDFIDSLKDLCPLFGYTGLRAGMGIKINPSDPIVIDDCPNTRDLIF